MKKLSTILQLPIMEILNGKKVGQTKDIIMNLDTKDIAFVLDESALASFFVIKGEDIKGIGRDVILIKTSQSIQVSQDNTELFKELGEYYTVMGLCVISSEGNIEGEVADLLIDEKKQKILDLELDNGKTYSTDKIISISDKYVFVQEEEDNDGPAEEISISVPEPKPETDAKEDIAEDDTEESEEEPEEVKDESEYLIGMTMTDDVANEDGSFIVKKGTALTEEIINQAKEYGVYANLILNAE